MKYEIYAKCFTESRNELDSKTRGFGVVAMSPGEACFEVLKAIDLSGSDVFTRCEIRVNAEGGRRIVYCLGERSSFDSIQEFLGLGLEAGPRTMICEWIVDTGDQCICLDS